jgi:hypothetical protein
MLCAAWALSAASLAVNQLVFNGAGIGPGPALGVVSLVVQALIAVGAWSGSRVARAGAVVFALVAALPLQLVGRLAAENALFSAAVTVTGLHSRPARSYCCGRGARGTGSSRWSDPRSGRLPRSASRRFR